MRQGRIAGRVMPIALCAIAAVFGTSAFAGTAVFTGDSDPVLLTPLLGTVTYAADTFTLTTDDSGGSGQGLVDIASVVGTPALVGLGEVEFTMSDVSGVGDWWHKYIFRVYISDGVADVGVIDCAFHPDNAGAVAAVITIWDGGWGQETQIAADWALPADAAMHTKVEITGTAITLYYHDGVDWVASAAIADLTNLPILGDVTAAGYTTWPQIVTVGSAYMPLVFDELRLTGPEIPDVNGGAEGEGEGEYVGTEKVDILPLDAAPVLDGSDADAVWADIPWVRCSDTWDLVCAVDPDDLSCQFKVGYLGNSIYVFADLSDGGDNNDQANSLPWERDSIEIYMDIQRIGGLIGDGATQSANWIATGGPTQFRFHSNGTDMETDTDGVLTADMAEFATDTSQQGKAYYEIDLKAPADVKALIDHGSFGFGFQVNDADTGSRTDSVGWLGGTELPWGEYHDVTGNTPYSTADDNAEAGFVEPAAEGEGEGEGECEYTTLFAEQGPLLAALAAATYPELPALWEDWDIEGFEDYVAWVDAGSQGDPPTVGDGIPDAAQMAMLAYILCLDGGAKGIPDGLPAVVQAIYADNLAAIEAEYNGTAFEVVTDLLAGLLGLSPEMCDTYTTLLGVTGSYQVFQWQGGKVMGPYEPFFGADGDLDQDGDSNLDEWLNADGDVDAFLAAVVDPWMASGVPVAGLLGLGLLASAAGAAGAAALRRPRSRRSVSHRGV